MQCSMIKTLFTRIEINYKHIINNVRYILDNIYKSVQQELKSTTIWTKAEVVEDTSVNHRPSFGRRNQTLPCTS